jgi:pimeloyl-ACP methyl ester carboxylesterase
VNRNARWDVPVMSTLLAIVVLGGWWGLADGITGDDQAPPQPNFISAPPPAAYGRPDTVEYKPGLQLDVFRPRKGDGPFPAVLLIHGGGFEIGSRGDLYFTGAKLAYQGVVAASIDYTLNGLMDPASADVADAYRWLAHQPDVDPKRIAVLGTSAGCALSAKFALTTHEPRAAVLVACPAFFPELVSEDEPEILLVNNTADGAVPIAYSRTIAKMLDRHGARYDTVVHQGGDHFSTLGDNWDAVAAWLLPRLKA